VLHAYDIMQLGDETFIVVVEQPTRTAFALVDEARWLSLLVIGLAAIISGVVVLLVVRQITTPIRRLSYAARAISSGNLKKRVDIQSQDEVGQLAQAFNDMAGRLADMVDNLEERIQERTQRLQQVEIELRREKNFLQRVMDNSLSAILVVTAEGQIVFANSHAQELLGLNEDDPLSTDFVASHWQPTDFSGDVIPNDSLPFYQILNTREPVSDYEIAISSTHGERLYLSMSGVPLLDAHDRIERIVFSFNDLSLRQRWQQQLEDALTRERELNELQARFVTLISHELRTPLSIILTSASLIQRNASSMTPQQLTRRADKMQRQVERLRHIMNDVLFINKTDQKKETVQYTTVELMPFCQEIIQDLTLTLQDTPPVTLQTDNMPDEIISDNVLLHHILSNLLSNAMKYTPPDGQVTLVMTAAEDSYCFCVKDTGIGIPEDYQPKLFQSFVRADNVSNIPGTGLGLVIAQRSVQMLEGSINVDSAPGDGTTFIVRLPRLHTVPSDRMLTSPDETETP
jgi:PAS domain S-box-containing protein